MTLTFELQFNVGRAWGTKHCAFMCLRAQEESPKKVIFDLKPEHEVKEEGWGMVQSQTLSLSGGQGDTGMSLGIGGPPVLTHTAASQLSPIGDAAQGDCCHGE